MNKKRIAEAPLPLVSVVIPFYNNKKWLPRALNSILSQTYNNIEVIVVDDGSEEDISDIQEMQDERVKLYRNKNFGPAFSRNYGISKSNGKYISFLDSDDFWEENKLEIQISAMEKNNAVWSQHNYYYYYDEKNKKKKINTYRYKGKEKRQLFLSWKVQTSSVTVRRKELVENNIRYDENRRFGEDDAFYFLLAKRYPLLCVNEYLTYFRIHGSNSGKSVRNQILNRAYTWQLHKDDMFFVENTSRIIRYTYRYCDWCSKLINQKKETKTIVLCLMYAPAWIIFKICGFLELNRK